MNRSHSFSKSLATTGFIALVTALLCLGWHGEASQGTHLGSMEMMPASMVNAPLSGGHHTMPMVPSNQTAPSSCCDEVQHPPLATLAEIDFSWPVMAGFYGVLFTLLSLCLPFALVPSPKFYSPPPILFQGLVATKIQLNQ